MSVLCPLCEKANVEIRAPYRGVHSTFVGLDRVRCISCDLFFASPMPNEQDLADYNSSYFDAAHGGASSNIISISFFTAIARLRQSYLEKYLKSRQIVASTVLELGPGPGYFAKTWIERHPDTTYMARETDISCHDGLNRIGVQLLSDNSKEVMNPIVDLVVMSHVLEHVANPKSFVMDATQNLRIGGVLFLEVPCLDYLHKPIDEPHLLFFDKKSMEYLLRVTGFENIELGYFGQEIKGLKSTSLLKSKLISVRARLLNLGIRWPFTRKRRGMEAIVSPIERAAVAPFKAHVECVEPAWWLRVVAQKKLTEE